MKTVICFFAILIIGHFGWLSLSQSQSSEKEAVKSTIEQFFEAFHKQDSTTILQTVHKDIKMQSTSGINNDSEEPPTLNTSAFSDFLKSIVSIPKDKTFKEEILSYNIQIDGNMAHAWTPYNFYFDGNFSHCGVNSFQLFKDAGQWKIIYLIDTRRQDCDFDKLSQQKD